MTTLTDPALTPAQRAMLEIWERHLQAEFADHSADAALGTMSVTPHLNHVPVMTGASGASRSGNSMRRDSSPDAAGHHDRADLADHRP